MGMSLDYRAIDRLREAARARGVSPADEDLEAVLGFLDRILPALEEIERLLPQEQPT